MAEHFRTSWYTVYSSAQMAVQWGRANVNLSGITAIGVDELCRDPAAILPLVRHERAGGLEFTALLQT